MLNGRHGDDSNEPQQFGATSAQSPSATTNDSESESAATATADDELGIPFTPSTPGTGPSTASHGTEPKQPAPDESNVQHGFLLVGSE